jgi:hypothetical protein
MSKSKVIRYRSLLFVQELLKMFNPTGSELDVENFINTYIGAFQANIGSLLCRKIVEISTTCAELFSSDGDSFVWEAVRCASSTKDCEEQTTLMMPYKCVISIITPWCKFVNLADMSNEVVNAEFYKFLLDNALSGKGEIIDCWNEVSRSPDYGERNSDVLLDTLTQVYSRVERFRSECIILVGHLFVIRPELIASMLAHHLSAAGTPWKQSGSATSKLHDSQSTIKAFLNKVDKPLETGDSNLDQIPTAKTVAVITAQMIVLDFETFTPHLPVLLNFVMCHLGLSLQETTHELQLFESMIHGYISMLHSSGKVNEAEYYNHISAVRKLLGWFEMENCTVNWDINAKTSVLTEATSHEVHFEEILSMVLNIHRPLKPDLIPLFTAECLIWAKEGYLDPSKANRIHKIYSTILMNPVCSIPSPSALEDNLLERIFDQISVLRQIEAGIGADKGSPAEAWMNLPKGMNHLKVAALDSTYSVMHVQSVLLERYHTAGTMASHTMLFWATIG